MGFLVDLDAIVDIRAITASAEPPILAMSARFRNPAAERCQVPMPGLHHGVRPRRQPQSLGHRRGVLPGNTWMHRGSIASVPGLTSCEIHHHGAQRGGQNPAPIDFRE